MTCDELIEELRKMPHNCDVEIVIQDEDGDPIENPIGKIYTDYEAAKIFIWTD